MVHPRVLLFPCGVIRWPLYLFIMTVRDLDITRGRDYSVVFLPEWRPSIARQARNSSGHGLCVLLCLRVRQVPLARFMSMIFSCVGC